MSLATLKSLRLHIGIMGRTNTGKSSFMNLVAGQDIAITSDSAGTTTDVIEKVMELSPIGPVVLLDTAGIDDSSELGEKRVAKTQKAMARMNIVALVVEPDEWTDYEDEIVNRAAENKIPVLVVINKADLKEPSVNFLSLLDVKKLSWVAGSSLTLSSEREAERFKSEFKTKILSLLPEYSSTKSILGDLCGARALVVLVVPIDLGAPKGRLILPQVQVLRELLDSDASAIVVKEIEYEKVLKKLNAPPDLVICDSQVISKVAKSTPDNVPLTTFSVLFSRYKGDIVKQAAGAAIIEKLKDNDKVLIAEGCSHHPLEDDIGRVKIPRLLRQYTGKKLIIDTCAGHDFPSNLHEYKLIIHCGGCVMTEQEMSMRIHAAEKNGVAITNYGIAISAMQGVLKRVLSPFKV